jgi:hypothetical protein
MLNKVVMWQPSIFAFISGIVVSTATNLLTSLVTSVDPAICRPLIITSAGLFLSSGILLMLQTWSLEEPHNKWKEWKAQQVSGVLDARDEDIQEKVLSGNKIIWIIMTSWIMLFAAGLVLVVLAIPG